MAAQRLLQLPIASCSYTLARRFSPSPSLSFLVSSCFSTATHSSAIPAQRSLLLPTIGSRSFSTTEPAFVTTPESTVEITPSGWRPPTGPLPGLTFSVTRVNKINLPVYSERRNQKMFTILRKYEGNVEDLKQRLRQDLQVDVIEKAGHLLIVGNKVMEIKMWLLSLGF
eukprot:TRINITY_DN2664_c0_g1_i1.p1 TRINITY_DN2664_c0_g1~~TRINITY_DN2664_c0_g1_i1.p1  ORF type:complete len:169 (-),score=33.84 TRINITY_DN2664_c0_g1_i1:63-569(-)